MPAIQPSALSLLKSVYPFSDLDNATLNLLLPYLEQREVVADEVIFEPGQHAGAFYFILAGKVEVYHYRNKLPVPLQFLRAFDHFGEDALLQKKRQTGAIARSSATLLSISRPALERLSFESSIIKRIFHMFASTYQNYCRKDCVWREPAETTYLQLRRHPFTLWAKLLPILLITLLVFAGLLFLAFTSVHLALLCLIAALLTLFLGGSASAWEVMAWRNEYFVLTKDRVLVQKLLVGVFESRQETPMSAVLSVELATSFIGRLIGYGTVTARAYTGNLPIRHIPDPDLLYAYLEYRRKSILADQRRREQETMHSLLENRFHPERTRSTIPAPADADVPTKVNYYTDTFSDLLARFFTLRLEKEDSIIYRTHWWILLRKLFLPSLCLLLIVVLVLSTALALLKVDATFIYSLAILAAVASWAWWFYEYADWRMDVYIITPDQLVDVNVHPLGKEDKRSAPVKNIQTVEYKRNGLIGMALNFGTVSIQIGNERLTFDNVYNPSAIQMEIFNRFREFSERSRKLEEKHMTDWFTTYDGIRHEGESDA